MAVAAWAQTAGARAAPERGLGWQAVGPWTIELNLAGPAGGEVADVAFTADGGSLYALTARGAVWASSDLGETWQRVAAWPAAMRRPGEGLKVLAHPFDSRYAFALGRDLHRSSDRGRSWVNVTADSAGPVIGGEQRAIAFSPLDPELIVVANSRGLWRSADGGLSWMDLNRGLPNLPAARLLAADAQRNAGAAAVFLEGVGPAELDSAGGWRPTRHGSVEKWLEVLAALPVEDQKRRSPWPMELPEGWGVSYRVWRAGAVSADLTSCAQAACQDPERHYISALAGSGETGGGYYYAGTSDGHLWVSRDGGVTWRAAMDGFSAAGRAVTAIFASPREPRAALVVVDSREGGRVFRTTNGGIFWDDLTADLPAGAAYGVAANPETGSIYLATEAGVFYTRGDLRDPAPPTPWTRLAGNLPSGAVEDVRLLAGNLYVAVAGYGVFRAATPEIADALRVLNAADLTERAAAPGGLLTVIGAPIRAARAGALTAPVLASSAGDSQIQVPFEASGKRLDLALETPRGAVRVGVALEEVAPAIFVDADGSPLVLDAAGGVLLDSSRPAQAGAQLLVLATGLGRVRPSWPTGLAAPLEDPPVPIAPVAAYLDGAPLRVISATLAGGYIGVYLVRVELPAILNSGTGELAIGAADKLSNKVRIFLAP